MADNEYDAQQVELLRQTLIPIYGRYLSTTDVISILKSVGANPSGNATIWYNQILATVTNTPISTQTPRTPTPSQTKTSTTTKTSTQNGRQQTPTGPPSTQTVTTTPTSTATLPVIAGPTSTVSTNRPPATATLTPTPTSSLDPSIWSPVTPPTAIPGTRGGDGYVSPSPTAIATKPPAKATAVPPATGAPTPNQTPTSIVTQTPTSTATTGATQTPTATPTTITSTETPTAASTNNDNNNIGSLGYNTWPLSTIPIGTIPAPTYPVDTSTYQFTADNVPGMDYGVSFTDESWGNLSPTFQDDYKVGDPYVGNDIFGGQGLTLGTNTYSPSGADAILSSPYALTSGILSGYGMGDTATNRALYSNAVGNVDPLFELYNIAGMPFSGSGVTIDPTTGLPVLPDNLLTNQAMGDYATSLLRSQQQRGGGIDPYKVFDLYFNAGADPNSIGSQALFGGTAKEQYDYAIKVFDAASVNMNPMMRQVLGAMLPQLYSSYLASGVDNYNNGFVEYLMNVPMIRQILGG